MDVKTVWEKTGAKVKFANKVDFDKAEKALEKAKLDVKVEKNATSFEMEITSAAMPSVKDAVAVIERI